jgi:hypothetical protein
MALCYQPRSKDQNTYTGILGKTMRHDSCLAGDSRPAPLRKNHLLQENLFVNIVTLGN